MANPKSLFAWADIRAMLDRALYEEVTITFPNEGAAKKFRLSAYSVRSADRRQSKKSYQPHEPAYDTSPYDDLSLILEGKSVRITKVSGQLEGKEVKIETRPYDDN